VVKQLFDNDYVKQQIQDNKFVSTVAQPKVVEQSMTPSINQEKKIFSPVSVKQLSENGFSSPRALNLVSSLESPTGILEYGQDIMTNISEKSDKFLKEVKDADVEFVEKQLTSVLTLAKSMSLSKKKDDKFTLSNLFDRVKETFIDAKEQLLAEFNDVSVQMDRVVSEVENANSRILDKLKGLRELYQENLNDYKQLDILIADAEEVLNFKKKEMEEKRNASQTLDAFQAEELNRMNRILDRLDKKIHNLKKFQLMAVQNAPSIAQMEDSAITLLEKFHDIKTMTIPLWKKQMRLYIDGQELQRGAKLAQTVDNANNSLIKANSDSVSQNAIDTARLNQRAIIDDETAEHVHQNLINTLDEVININREGQEKRIQSANRMDEMKRMYLQISSGASPSQFKNN
jgi:uncharacterized protein YaaN involved in tellurite resistance